MNTQNKVQKNVVVTETKVALNITNSEAIAIAKAAQEAKPTYKAAKVVAFDTADTALIEQFKKNRAFLIVKHTSKVHETESVAFTESETPKRGRKPLPSGFGKAEVYLACANYAKTEYVILSRIAILSCFEHEVKELNIKNQMLQDAIAAYNENNKNKSVTVERKRAAYNPYITADEAQQLSINDIIKNVQEKQAIIQRRVDTKDERMQKRAEHQKMLAERAERREKRQLRKAQEAAEKAVKTVVAVA
jgi:hypothetical protein